MVGSGLGFGRVGLGVGLGLGLGWRWIRIGFLKNQTLGIGVGWWVVGGWLVWSIIKPLCGP